MEADVPTFVTTDLGGLHARCPACRRHRPGSDFLRTETRCRDCDGGAYDRSLARRGEEIEGPGHRRWWARDGNSRLRELTAGLNAAEYRYDAR